MKRQTILAIFFCVCISLNIAIASPGSRLISFICPGVNPKNYPFVVSNFKDYIAGYGKEYVDGEPMIPNPYLVTTISPGSTIPANLTMYVNAGVEYDSTLGQIYCTFSSPELDGFTVAYQLTNGRGGVVISHTDTVLNMYIPFGIQNNS